MPHSTTRILALALALCAQLAAAVPLAAPLKYRRPPLSSPTSVESAVWGKKFDEKGNEISLTQSAHLLETRRRQMTERADFNNMEFEAAVTPVVNVVSTDGIAGHTTYRLALDLSTRSDAENIYSIHGTAGKPLSLPPAFQVPTPFGSDYAGVSPQIVDVNPEAAFDSWLTIGIVDGPAATTEATLAMLGLDLNSWSNTQGVYTEDGAMFFMDPANGPTLEDRDGALGVGSDRGEVVVAQLTVPSESSFTVTMNAQGRTRGWAAKAKEDTNWNEESITFQIGDEVLSDSHTMNEPPPPDTYTTNYEDHAVTPVVQTISTDAIAGHTTFRLALRLRGNAQDIYSIYGVKGHPLIIPAAFHNPAPFGVNVGGVSPAFFGMDMPNAAESEYDSWLTVGLTSGAGSELSSIGMSWPSWTDTTGLEVDDGSVFWMNPDDAPGLTDHDGATGPATDGGDTVIAQLTVKNSESYSAVVNAQGHETPSTGLSGHYGSHTTGRQAVGTTGSWNEMDIEFTFGATRDPSAGPCSVAAEATIAAHGRTPGHFIPDCDAMGEYIAMQCRSNGRTDFAEQTDCYCVDEQGQQWSGEHAGAVVHTANPNGILTEQDCITARSVPWTPPAPAPVPAVGEEIQGEMTMNLDWMSPEEFAALNDPTSEDYGRTVQRLRDHMATLLNVPADEVHIDGIIAQLTATTPAPEPSAPLLGHGPSDGPAPPPAVVNPFAPSSCAHTPFATYRPCQNGGSCNDRSDHVQAHVAHCECNGHWSGDLCEVWDTVDSCQTKRCEPGHVCADLFGIGICSPTPMSPPVPPVCEGRCQNGAVCRGTGDMAWCDCPANYGGVYCTQHDTVDRCLTRPCQNGGECNQIFGEIRCVCDATHSGRRCETPIAEDRNDCEPGGSRQCVNGGKCIDQFQGFACICPDGFLGPNCNTRTPTPNPTPAPETHSHHGGFYLVVFFLLAGLAAVGVVAYEQRTDLLRQSLSTGEGIRAESMHGSVYENSIYFSGEPGSHLRDSSMAASVGAGKVAPGGGGGGSGQPNMLEKAKKMAAKASRGVAAPNGSGDKSIYDTDRL